MSEFVQLGGYNICPNSTKLSLLGLNIHKSYNQVNMSNKINKQVSHWSGLQPKFTPATTSELNENSLNN